MRASRLQGNGGAIAAQLQQQINMLKVYNCSPFPVLTLNLGGQELPALCVATVRIHVEKALFSAYCVLSFVRWSQNLMGQVMFHNTHHFIFSEINQYFNC